MTLGRLGIAALIGVFCVFGARTALAQAVSVSGTVSDATAARPLIGTLVTLGVPGSERTARTDERGVFTFDKVAPGRYTLVVRRLGYEPFRETIEPKSGDAPIVVTLTRVASLDTVRVLAAQQGIYGAVATAHDLRPLRSATIRVIGVGGGKISVDSTAHFFVPIKTPGAYVVRAQSGGYQAQTVSVTVRPGEGVEVAMLLDSATTPASNRLEMAMADFDDRLKVRKQASALMSRAELLRYDDRQILGAIRAAPSFVAKGLRFGASACVFVDGRPFTGSMDAFEPKQIEAVEVYGEKGDATGTLAKAWPRGFPCGDTGMPSTAPGGDVVKWVVIWIKQ
ncbi:MAG TPA: carboxypeptidase regulatory-like domain-containing protein [Gemmatimonadaceae bacterium]|nr:carboxypeptidase regulatory-like domain-containing protein [Gemmatimonadaceae bacterium]